jgi:hypothetical protein
MPRVARQGALDPGKYEVILEAMAAGMLMARMLGVFDARQRMKAAHSSRNVAAAIGLARNYSTSDDHQ